MTYYSVFKDVKKVFKELHLLLIPEQAHKRAFAEVPIICFKNAKSLKDHIALLPKWDKNSTSKPCELLNRLRDV